MKNVLLGFLTAVIAAGAFYFFLLVPSEDVLVDEAPQVEVFPEVESTPQEDVPQEDVPQVDTTPQIEGVTIITYNVNGGDALENRFDKVNYGDNITMTVPTRAGYTFLGWSLNNVIIENGIWAIEGNVELVAEWNVDTYTIVYNNVDGCLNNNPDSYVIDNQTFSLVSPIKLGYTFLGWYSDESLITEIDSTNLENIELTAKWSINNYTISYSNLEGALNNNVSSFTVEDGIIVLNDLSRLGYTFEGWYSDNKLVTEIDSADVVDMELEAKWKIDTYSITYTDTIYALNSNPDSYTIEDGTISLVSLSKDGYIFLGWYSDNKLVTEIDSTNLVNVELVAKWNINSYTITYNEDLDYVINSNPETFTAEDTIILEDAIREDYIFLGWYSDASLTNEVTEITALENTVLYASWRYDWVLSATQEALLAHYQAIIDETNLANGTSTSSFFALNAGDTGYEEGVTSLKFSNYLDVSGVTNMSYMFSKATRLEVLDASNYDTSSVTTMDYMFNGCTGLIYLNLNNFNTENVTTMASMFSSCSKLTSLNVSSFDTSNVTTMSAMFSNCTKLTSLDASSFDTSNVTTMSSMFNGCNGLTSLDVSSFDTSNVTTMASMFRSCSSLTSLDVTSFDTSNVTSLYYTFYGCSSLTSLDVSSFNTSKVTTLAYTFSYCSSLTTLDLSNFVTSSVTTLASTFSYCSALTTLNITSFNTSNVTTLSNTFAYCSSLLTMDLTHFTTSKVTTLICMFRGCTKIKTINVTGWYTGNVENVQYTFAECSALTTISGISSWNVSKLTTTTSKLMTFYNSDKLTRPSWY